MDGELLMRAAKGKHYYLDERQPYYDRWGRQGAVPRELWVEAEKQDLFGVEVPESHGRLGGYLAHDAIIISYIVIYGTEEQKSQLLPRLMSGALIGAIVRTKPTAGGGLKALRTKAVMDGNEFIRSG
ncbi:MAG: acyl-CoA dehydrogenase family protein, partial [Pseudomonadota bacterium]